MSGPFHTLYQRSNLEGLPFSPKALLLREEGWEAFKSLGFPQRTHEEWKYTSLRLLQELPLAPCSALVALESAAVEKALSPHILKDDLLLVFVNGVLSKKLSHVTELPQGLTVTSMTDAVTSWDEGHLENFIKPSKAVRPDQSAGGFRALNDAFLKDGVVLHIAPRAKISRTIHLLHLVTADHLEQPAAFFPRHILHLGEGAEAEIVETFSSILFAEGQRDLMTYVVSPFSEVLLQKGARLSHLRVSAEGATGIHVGTVRARLERDAYLGTFSLTTGGRLTRLDVDITLEQSGAEVDLDGLYLARNSQHVDHHTVVEHKVPHATSRQLYKGILGDSSRAVFNGKVLVREGAHGTQAFQLNQNLLLSSDAEIDTKPELQIDADDVKCSHGAAIGQLDAYQMFYLQSRGLTEKESKTLLCTAFSDEALLKVKTKNRFEKLRRLVMDDKTV